MSWRLPWLVSLCIACSGISWHSVQANEPNLLEQEQAAFIVAAQHAVAVVVRIETVGGLETVGEMLLGTGPTTGLIVSEDGYIISSSFNFVQRPSSILVTLPDGTRLPARLVATDHNRMLTLLKVDASGPLPVPVVAPPDELQVGQWVLALGRTYDGDLPAISAGILSATRRIEGRALQTDAKISPANYGGPLIDLQGRVLGILVPLAPGAGTEIAGVEWYDSGIGFAIPLEDVLHILPRLTRGEDLHPGKLGINLAETSPFEQPIVGAIHPTAPAAKAGLQAGDRIVAAAGKSVRIRAEFEAQLKPLYAGDTLDLTVARGADNEHYTLTIPLIGETPSYARPLLGIIPNIAAPTTAAGVAIQDILPASPAEEAGLQPNDVIMQLADQPVRSTEQLRTFLADYNPGATVRLSVERDGQAQAVTVTLGEQPQQIASELAPAISSDAAMLNDEITRGRLLLTMPERAESLLAFVPTSYRPEVPHRVFVFLNGAQQPDEDALLAMWQPYCETHGLILLAPRHLPSTPWQSTDLPLIERGLALLAEQYHIAQTQTILHGFEAGAELAAQFTSRHPEQVRGLAIVGAPLTGRFGPASPLDELDFYVAAAEGSEAAAALEKAVIRLRELQHPVAVRSLGDTPRYLNTEELDELMRWVESLNRL